MPIIHPKCEGLWVPRALLEAEGLGPSERMLLARINSLDQGERACFATNQALGQFLGLSPGRTRNMITKLKENKWLNASYSDGNRRSLRVIFPPDRARKNVRPPCAKTCGEDAQKCAGEPAQIRAHSIRGEEDDKGNEKASSDDALSAIKTIRRIYCETTGRPWLKSDEKMAKKLINIDPRIVECGILSSYLKKKWGDNGQIFSFAYFRSEIEVFQVLGLGEIALNARLISLRQKLSEIKNVQTA